MPGRNFTDAEEEQIGRIYLAGHSARAIARAYGKAHHISVVAALGRQGIKQRSPAERNRLYSLNPHVFDTIDNEHAAYWLGFLYADGCVHKRSLQLSIKRSDVEQLIKLKAFLESEAPIKNTLAKDGTSNKKHQQAFFLITDRHLTDRLRKLGVTIGRPDYRPMIDGVPCSLYNHLIRGYFDGDGSARKSQSLAFCGSRPLLIWIRDTVAQFADTNPDLAITKHSIADLYYLYFSGRKVALRAAEYLYRGATIWLARKRNVIDSWVLPQEMKRDERGRFC
jgi:hypothetical protein